MPRRYISVATKLKAVADWKAKRKTSQQLQDELKVTSGMLSHWGMQVEKGQLKQSMASKTKEEHAPPPPVEQAVSPPTTAVTTLDGRKRVDDATKERAIAEFAKGGRSAKEVGAEFGVTDATIYMWVKKAKSKGTAPRAFAQLAPSVAGMDAGVMLLDKALRRMHQIMCPNCGHTFNAQTPGYTESLVIMARHLMAGEEP